MLSTVHVQGTTATGANAVSNAQMLHMAVQAATSVSLAARTLQRAAAVP